MEPNDEAPAPDELPTIKLVWDATKQSVAVQFDSRQFQTWDFVLGVLEMAKNTALFSQEQGRLMNLQRQAIAQQQHRAVKQLINGR